MSVLSKVVDFFGGGTANTILDIAKTYWPPSLTKDQVAAIEKGIVEATRQHELKLQQLALDQDHEFNNRIKEMEGTAKDLQQFGWVGQVIVFLRGCQRPIFGYFTIGMDYMIFSGKYVLPPQTTEFPEPITATFYFLNILVLVFLFGERALRNVIPLLNQLMNRFKK